jgi:hypothetical protein
MSLSISYPQTSFNNSIEINVKNDTNVDAESLTVEINNIPSWFIFEKTLIVIDKINRRSNESITFNFYLAEDAPEIYDHKILVIVTGKNNYSSKEIRISNSIINTFNLFQNYPNPFNPVTNIQYQIAEKQLVTLKIYDVIGNEIAVLINEVKDAGTYNVEFNADRFSSGVYYYTLKAGSFISTKKMILLK